MRQMKRYLFILCVLALLLGTLGVGASAENLGTASIPVSFRHGGSVPEDPEVFTVELIPTDPTFPMPAESTDGAFRLQGTVDLPGTIYIPCDRVGVFTYTVRQIPGTDPQCVYDTAEYRVTVYVTYAEGGGVEINVVAHKDGAAEKVDIEFYNYYGVPDGVTITAIKTLDKRTPRDGQFSFQLLNDEGDVLQTVKNEGKEVTFQTLFFDAVGTFTFTIREVIGKDSNIIYDKTEYEAVIEVIRNENHDYVARLTYLEDGDEHTGTPTFANRTVTGTPKTGDTVNILLYAVIFIAAAAALVVIIRKKRKKEE